jgi:ribosomal protein L11 methyltransferase
MILRLPSGLRISIFPCFPWETRHPCLVVKSGSAFYPGHVTTKLCLDLMDDLIRPGRCRSLLDVGCGSGILALAAAYLGVPCVVGLDVDPRAVETAKENAGKNLLAENIHWLAGTTASVRGSFDSIAANLPFRVLIDLLPELAGLLKPRGRLIISGFQDIEFHAVKRGLASMGLEIEAHASGDQSFFGVPPSGSFTWMAILAKYTGRA